MGRPDPGGVFESDAHRRVLGHVDSHPEERKTRDTVPSLHAALEVDRFTEGLSEADVKSVLGGLEKDGYVSSSRGTYKRTAKGTKALNAEVAE